MKLLVTTVEEVEVPDTFPIYRIDDCHAYKIISDKEKGCLVVTHGLASLNMNAIHFSNHNSAYSSKDTRDCTKKEFENAYRKAIKPVKEALRVS